MADCGCGHSNGEHLLVCPPGVQFWGYRTCPAPGCECFSTWGVGELYGEEEIRERLAAWMDSEGLSRADLVELTRKAGTSSTD